MTVTTHWFVIGALLLSVLATISIWAPRSLKIKIAALVSVALLLPLGYTSPVSYTHLTLPTTPYV